MENFDQSANEAENMARKFIIDQIKYHDLSVYKISKITDMSESTIHRWLKGESSISLNNFLKLVGSLQLRPYLIPAEMNKNKIVKMFFN